MADVQEIREIIVGFVKRTLPELKYQEIDTRQSMKELGATSIDALGLSKAGCGECDYGRQNKEHSHRYQASTQTAMIRLNSA